MPELDAVTVYKLQHNMDGTRQVYKPVICVDPKRQHKQHARRHATVAATCDYD